MWIPIIKRNVKKYDKKKRNWIFMLEPFVCVVNFEMNGESLLSAQTEKIRILNECWFDIFGHSEIKKGKIENLCETPQIHAIHSVWNVSNMRPIFATNHAFDELILRRTEDIGSYYRAFLSKTSVYFLVYLLLLYVHDICVWKNVFQNIYRIDCFILRPELLILSNQVSLYLVSVLQILW